MFVYELNTNEDSGYVHIKFVLHEIYDNDNQYNRNGISWQEPYVSKCLPTAIGKSITVEFTDEERTSIWGHGDTGHRKGMLECANATMVGTITDAYVTTIDIDGISTKVAMGEGQLDYYRYGAFIDDYRELYKSGQTLYGSVEVTGKKENNNLILYRDGYKETGRVLTEYVYSGFSLLSALVTQADDSAIVYELNSKKGEIQMTREEINQLLDEKYSSLVAEINAHSQSVEELNATIETLTAEKNEAIATSEKLQEALNACIKERDEKYAEFDALSAEVVTLREAIGKAKAQERVNELNKAIAEFTEDQITCVESEINAFKENPEGCGYTIESIVCNIKAKAYDAMSSQQNAELNSFEGMFLELETPDEEAGFDLKSDDLFC